MATQDKQSATIVLPIKEEEYERFLTDINFARKTLLEFHQHMPSLFPSHFSCTFRFNGSERISKKLATKLRKIEMNGRYYTIRPSFILSHNVGFADEVSKGLFLYHCNVSFWAIAYVLGHDPQWWYRRFCALASYDLVGTTVFEASDLPKHVLADEHHIKRQGEKAYVATTVAGGCFLGAEVSQKADQHHLEAAYDVFRHEAHRLDTDYSPVSVNTDGWEATQNAWKALFANICVIQCFLHAFLKIRDRATKSLQCYFHEAADKVWNIYKAYSKRSMAQQIRRFKTWVENHVPDSPMKNNMLKLCLNKNKWLASFDVPGAFRTSNMLDRVMRKMKLHKINSQNFHSDMKATNKNFRAFALLHNFCPMSPKARDIENNFNSPAEKFNQSKFHDDWLQNLLIAGNRAKLRHHRIP